MMMLDKQHIGHSFAPFETCVEKGRVRLFAKAIGTTNPIHFDTVAARVAGYKDIVAPLTFLYCLGADAPDPFEEVHLVGLDLARTVHGEERIEFECVLCAGDRVVAQKKIVDLYEKEESGLLFMKTRTDFRALDGAPIGATSTTVVMR